MGHQRLVDGVSSTVPEWVGSWVYGGARPEFFQAEGLVVACVVAVACGSFWAAGLSESKGPRALWMLNAAVACVGLAGAGDAAAVMLGAVAHIMGWGGARALGPALPSEGWQFGPTKAGLFGLVCLGLVGISLPLLWVDACVGFPSGVSVPAIAMATGVVLAVLSLWLRREHPRTAVSVMTAGLAGLGVLTVRSSTEGPAVDVWGWRADVLAESHLRRSLVDYRPDEREASVARHSRPEAATIEGLAPVLQSHAGMFGAQGRFLSDWLEADAAIYVSAPGKARESALNRAYSTLLKNECQPEAGVLSEMFAWVACSAGDWARATGHFEAAIRAQPRAAMAWYGYGLALRSAGRLGDAESAWCRWCLLEPRAVFSPVWTRPPMKDSQAPVMRAWREAMARIRPKLPKAEVARFDRFARWQTAWVASRGVAEQFLAASAPEGAGDYDPTVMQVRLRYRELLANPTEARIGAFYSAAVALLTDRHLNLGQCRRLHVVMKGEPDPVAGVPVSSLISRPRMPGWLDVSSFTEGGAGASLGDFEENLPVRLLTYGWNAGHVPVPLEELIPPASVARVPKS